MEKETIKKDKEVGYIKLMKNETSKGVVYYSWDIKLTEGAEKEEQARLIEQLKEVNAEMERSFPSLSSN